MGHDAVGHEIMCALHFDVVDRLDRQWLESDDGFPSDVGDGVTFDSEGSRPYTRITMAIRVRWPDYIAVNPEICHGKPCFKGTRIMVATILEFLEAGDAFREIKAGYPALTPRHLQAAVQFARETIQNGRVVTFRTARHAVSG